ncbi:MAG: transposase [Anaerolineae bacterium]
MSESAIDHHRRSIRLRGYDYASYGAYFVTFCIEGRLPLLGEVGDGEMRLSPAGEMVREVWKNVTHMYPGVAGDAAVFMPNHVHAIVLLAWPGEPDVVGATLRGRPGEKVNGDLGQGRSLAPTGGDAGSGQGWNPAPTGADNVGATLRRRPQAAPNGDVSGQGDDIPGQGWNPAPTDGGVVPGPDGVILGPGDAVSGQGWNPAPTGLNRPITVGDVVGRLKTYTMRLYGDGVASQGWPPYQGRLWQRNYYEHIIRNERELVAIRGYIHSNPMQWAMDGENPDRP